MKLVSHQFLALFGGVALIFTGCELQASQNQVEQITLQERLLSQPNPTNYKFDATISGITNAIRKAFDKWQEEQTKKYQRKEWEGVGDATTKHFLTLALQSSGLVSLFFKGDADALSKNLLTKAGNENDAYLFGSTSSLGESQVYFKGGHPLIYYADFHIHLTAISPQKTRVEIFTYGSRVVTGVDKRYSPHGPSLIFVEVPPTTIEQYQILLRIGQQLGITNMPPLVVPGRDASVRELTLPRER